MNVRPREIKGREREHEQGNIIRLLYEGYRKNVEKFMTKYWI